MSGLRFPDDIELLTPDAKAAFMATYTRVMKATDNDEQKALLAAFGALRRLCNGMPIKSRNGFKQMITRIEASSRQGVTVHGHVTKRPGAGVIPDGFYDNLDQYIEKPVRTARITPKTKQAFAAAQKLVEQRQRENAMLYALMHELAEKRRYTETINIVQPYYPRHGVPFRGRLIVIRRQPVKDDHRQYFTPYTRHGLTVGQVLPATHDHTYESIGYAKVAKITESGVWLAGEYDRDHPTGLTIYHNSRAGVPYYLSSGADKYSLKFAADGAILHWPVWEAALTTEPADYDTKVTMRY